MTEDKISARTIAMEQIHELCTNMTATEKKEIIKKASMYKGTFIDEINKLTINGYLPSIPRLKATYRNLRKIIGVLSIALLINGCGRLHTQMPGESNKTYTISRYHNGMYVGGWHSKTKVYLKFEDQFIEVIGDYTIKEN